MLQRELHRRRRIVAAVRAQREALQEMRVPILPGNAKRRAIDLSAREHLELWRRGVEVGDGAVIHIQGEAEARTLVLNGSTR